MWNRPKELCAWPADCCGKANQPNPQRPRPRQRPQPPHQQQRPRNQHRRVRFHRLRRRRRPQRPQNPRLLAQQRLRLHPRLRNRRPARLGQFQPPQLRARPQLHPSRMMICSKLMRIIPHRRQSSLRPRLRHRRQLRRMQLRQWAPSAAERPAHLLQLAKWSLTIPKSCPSALRMKLPRSRRVLLRPHPASHSAERMFLPSRAATARN